MSTDPPGSDETSDAALNDAAIAVALSGRPYEIADLWELPGNPHDGDDVAVAESLARFGQVKPIAVSADGCVIAGNTTFRAARDLLGWSRIAGVEMTQAEAEQKAYALADNRTSQLGRDDPERMVAFFGEIEDWSGIGWDEDARAEIAALIAEPVVTPTPEASPADDTPDEPPEDPITEPGDVWSLGPHRVICGDCRLKEVVDELLDGALVNLIVTSPPYADRREYDETSGFKPIRPDEYVEWFRPLASIMSDVLAPDGSFFLNIKEGSTGGRRERYVLDLFVGLMDWGWRYIDQYVWPRPAFPIDPRNARRFKNGWEPVMHYTREDGHKFRPEAVMVESDAAFTYDPDRKMQGNSTTGFLGVGRDGKVAGLAFPSNVLPGFGVAATGTDHPAAYPAALPAWFVQAFTDEDDVVFDPFMGSGSTLLAAHMHGRVAVGTEISAGYCDLIARRFQRVTGIVPLLNGEPIDFEPVAA